MRYSLRKARSPIKIPENWPTPANRRATRETQFLDSLVYGIIKERQAEGNTNHHHDLLAMLMSAMDEDGTQMTPRAASRRIHDAISGRPRNHGSHAFLGLVCAERKSGRRSAAARRTCTECLAGRAPELADFERLPYLRAVMNETLRLYPAAYIVARTSMAPCTIAGYDFPADTTMIMAQWVMHRDPRYFDDPEAFRPERWLDGLENRLPAGAYFPFGDGPRRCIGQGFALLESALVLATIAQKYSFKLVPGHPVIPDPLVTLRAKHGIRMTFHAANEAPSGSRRLAAASFERGLPRKQRHNEMIH